MKKSFLVLLVFFSINLFAAEKAMTGHHDGVWKVKFSPEGDFFLTTGGEGSVKMWWTSCLCALTSFEHDKKDFQVYDADFFPDGRVISTSHDASIYVWFRETGEQLAKVEGHTLSTARVRVSPDGSRFFTASSDGKVRIYDSQTYALLDELPTKSPVGIVPVGPSLNSILTVGLDGIQLWDLTTKTNAGLSSSAYYFAAEPISSHEVLVGGNPTQGGPLEIWDTNTRQVTRQFEQVDGYFWQIAVSRDGKWIGASSFKGKAHVWERATGKRIYSTPDNFGQTMSLDFFPDGRAMLVGDVAGTTRVVRF